MGCCFSSNNKYSPHPDPPSVESRAPPPVFEEETVKEVVLSETTLSKPQTPRDNTTTQMPVIEEEDYIQVKDFVNKHPEEDDVTQVSEIYSISESYSTTTTATTTTTTTTTTAITDKREDEAISKPTIRESNHRSPAKVPRKRPYTGVKSSLAKRSDVGPRGTIPRNVGPNGVRRVTGEGPSCRRSATRTVGGVGRSTGRVIRGKPGGLCRVEKAGQEMVVNDGDDAVLQEKKCEFVNNESLDNPHVSLECFIFL